MEVEESDFGMTSISIRSAGEKRYVRISLFIWPAFSITPGGATDGFKETESRGFRFRVPSDDTHTWGPSMTGPGSIWERATKRSSPCADFFSKRSEKFSKEKSRRTWCEILLPLIFPT